MSRRKGIKSRLAKRSGDFGKRMVRCFSVLDSSRLRGVYSRVGFFGTRELCILSGVPYRSLTRCLPEWVAKGYVEMRSSTALNVGDYEYRLCSPGKSWLYDARALPNYKQFHNDIVLWVNFVTKSVNYKILLDAKFNTLVECIDMMSDGLPAILLEQVWLHYDAEGLLIVDNFKNRPG